MNNQIKLAVSILSADFGNLTKQLRVLSDAGVHMIHFDVMDGHFVPNLSFGLPVMESIRSQVDLPFDVHLMINNPLSYLQRYANAGAESIAVHWEVVADMTACLSQIRSLGVKPAFAVNPATTLKDILPSVEYADRIMFMSVEPGFGGQKILTDVLRKSEKLANYLQQQNLDIEIEMDGGVNIGNLQSVLDAGVDIVVSGSGILSTSQKEMTQKVNDFLAVMQRNRPLET